MAIQKGRRVIWGVKPVCPIVNVPPDALKVRLRLRNDCYAIAYVRYADRVERWVIVPAEGSGLDGPEWALGVLQGVNVRNPMMAVYG